MSVTNAVRPGTLHVSAGLKGAVVVRVGGLEEADQGVVAAGLVDPQVTATTVVSPVTCHVTARRRGLHVLSGRPPVAALGHATIVARRGTCQGIARRVGHLVARMIVNVIIVEDLVICREIALRRPAAVVVDVVVEAIKNATNVVAQIISSVTVPRTLATAMQVHAATIVMRSGTSLGTARLRLWKPRDDWPPPPRKPPCPVGNIYHGNNGSRSKSGAGVLYLLLCSRLGML